LTASRISLTVLKLALWHIGGKYRLKNPLLLALHELSQITDTDDPQISDEGRSRGHHEGWPASDVRQWIELLDDQRRRPRQ
jgi:hypothetical protein